MQTLLGRSGAAFGRSGWRGVGRPFIPTLTPAIGVAGPGAEAIAVAPLVSALLSGKVGPVLPAALPGLPGGARLGCWAEAAAIPSAIAIATIVSQGVPVSKA